MQLTNAIIYLIGQAGAGKYTIANEIMKYDEFRLIDNQSINNLIFNLIVLDGITPISDKVWEKISGVRKIVLESIAELSPAYLSFIFTNELFDDEPEDRGIYEQLYDVSIKRHSKFIPVRLLCEEQELCRRVISPARKEKLKTVDAHRVRKNSKRELLTIQHPNLLTLDITQLTAKESANHIVQHIINKNS